MSDFAGGLLPDAPEGSSKNIVGMRSWEYAKTKGYNEKQIKRAVQQLRDSDSGIKPGEKLADWMLSKAAPDGYGIYHEKDPLGKYQGEGGGLGIKGYQRARGDGISASRINELLPSSGMNFGELAQNQYNTDIENETRLQTLEDKAEDDRQANIGLRDQIDSMLSMYEQKAKEPSTISKSAPYSVGTSSNASLKASSKASRRSSSKKSWNRGGADFKTALNSGAAASGKPSPSKSLNV